MSLAAVSTRRARLQDKKETKGPLFDFELHYDVSCESVRGVLRAILEDLSSYKQLHNWDEKITTTPLKALAAAAHGYLATSYGSSSNILLAHGRVDEVVTVNGVNQRRPAIQEAGKADSHLFFSKVWGPFHVIFLLR